MGVSPTNAGQIVFDKNPDKYRYAIKEWSGIISRGEINMDDLLTLEDIRSAVTITIEIAGDFSATVTLRTVKNTFTTPKFTAHSLLTHPVGSVIFPGVRVIASNGNPSQVKWVVKITIQTDI